MKNKFLPLLFTLLTTLAHAGNGWVSSGGDYLDEAHGIAWNTGNTPVSYCIERSSNFSIPENKIQTMIVNAVANWKKYYQQKAVTLSNQVNPPNFKLFLQNNCNGNENIKFALGTNTAEVKKLKAKFYNPFGFAAMKSFNSKTGIGTGIIYLADPKLAYPKADPFGINAMILHELGHVFGNGHVKNTIMDENIANFIMETGPLNGWPINDPYILNKLNSIDGNNTLLFNYRESWLFNGTVPFSSSNQKENRLQQEFFQNIMGRPFKGPVKMQFKNLGNNQNYFLTISDDQGQSEFKINPTNMGDITINRSTLFKTLGKNLDRQTDLIEGHQNNAWLLYTTMNVPNDKINIIINLFNNSNSIVEIKAIYQKEYINIFSTNPNAGIGR